MEESTKQLEEEWADRAEAESQAEEEREKEAKRLAKEQLERDREDAADNSMKLEPTVVDGAGGEKIPVGDGEDEDEVQAAARVAMPPPQALGASSAMQLQLYSALRSYSQLTPAEKMKSRRYAGLGLGQTEEHALAPQNPHAPIDWQTAAKVREQCPRCSPTGIEGLPCVCRQGVLTAHQQKKLPAPSLAPLFGKLPHKRLLAAPAPAEVAGGLPPPPMPEPVPHDDPRLAGTPPTSIHFVCPAQRMRRTLL